MKRKRGIKVFKRQRARAVVNGGCQANGNANGGTSVRGRRQRN